MIQKPVRWDQIVASEQEWIQCTKCGDKPRGQPAMYCSGCKKSHGEWAPNMMGLIIAARQSYSEQRSLLDHIVGKNNGVKQHLNLATKRTAELEAVKGKAAVKKLEAFKQRDVVETALARKNPATAAIAKRQAADLFDEVEGLFAEQVAIQRGADEAEAAAAIAEAELCALEETSRSSNVDLDALRRENQRLKDILVDVVSRRGGAAAAPPAVAVAPVAVRSPQDCANDVWAHIQRAQAARQPQLAGFIPVPVSPVPQSYAGAGQQYAPQPYAAQQPQAMPGQPININIGGGAPPASPAMPPGAYFVPAAAAAAPPVAPPGYAAVPVYSPQAPLQPCY